MSSVKLSFSLADRIGSPGRPPGERGALARGVVYGLVVPLTVAALVAAGLYIVTGNTPADLLAGLAQAPRIEMDMPSRPAGMEDGANPLIQPPSGSHDAKMTMEPVSPPPPAAENKPADDKPASAAPPPVALPPPALPSVAGVAPAVPPPSDPLIPPPGEGLAPPSFGQLPARIDLKPLGPAPINDLLRNSANGPLPIAAAGKEPRTAYARAFANPKNLAKIAVVVTGLGLSHDATEAAITKLPPDVSLSFSPYAGNLDSWIKRARANGHEVLLDLPLEPANFPVHDAGPLAVLSRNSPAEALAHLAVVLGKATGYVGLAAQLRSPVSAAAPWPALLQDVRTRGLLLVGDGLENVPAPQVPASAPVELVADETPFRAAIDTHLGRLLQAAQRGGAAVTYVQARPATLERLLAWFAGFPQKDVILAPVSAVARLPG